MIVVGIYVCMYVCNVCMYVLVSLLATLKVGSPMLDHPVLACEIQKCGNHL